MALAQEPIISDQAIMTFKVGENWSVSDLVAFLRAVETLYRHVLAALVAADFRNVEVDSPFAEVEIISPVRLPFSRQLRSAAVASSSPTRLRLGSPVGIEALAALTPESGLGIKMIEMASPGVISLQGAGEPIRELGALIERLSQIDVRRKQAKEELRKAQIENRHTEEMNRLAEEASEINWPEKR